MGATPKPHSGTPMSRTFTGDELVIASHNQGKVREIAQLLRPYVARFVSAGELGLPEPEETGTTFRENAELKARAAAVASGRPALSDDSGLVVPALGGRPSIYSARWAGPDRDFGVAMARIRAELPEGAPRDAHFVCALSLAWPDGHVETVEGRVHGALTFPPRGDRGFGYDPIFVPDGFADTFGEMEPESKDRISHRADAFRRLLAACFAR
jgi:XTP/dITP diphosphohydrolase